MDCWQPISRVHRAILFDSNENVLISLVRGEATLTLYTNDDLEEFTFSVTKNKKTSCGPRALGAVGAVCASGCTNGNHK